jgi:hypothetical protein
VKFVAVQLAILLLVGEVGLRVLHSRSDTLRVLLFMPSITSEFDELDTLPDLMSRTIIGYSPYERHAGFLSNSRGFRTPEYSLEKEDGTRRVVIIGDSFAFSCAGIPFAEHWPQLLEARLQDQRAETVEVLTLAAPGVGPLFERRLWEIEGSRMEPDVLLLQLFVGNDFTDHYEADSDEAWTAGLARRSYAVRLVRNGLRVLAARKGSLHAESSSTAEGESARTGGVEMPGYREEYLARPPFLSRERLMQVESQRARLCEASQHAYFVEMLARLTDVVGDLHDQVEAAGVEFRVVIIPDRFQVNPNERDEILARLRKDGRLFDWEKPQRGIVEFCRHEGIPVLDLLAASREAARTETLYDPGNTHWNLDGNAFAAREIAAWLGSFRANPEAP